MTQTGGAPAWAGPVARSKGHHCGCWVYVAAGSGGPVQRGREGGARPGGGAEAPAEACALVRPPPPAARAQPAERRELSGAAAEAAPREGGQRGQAQRSAALWPSAASTARMPRPEGRSAASHLRGPWRWALNAGAREPQPESEAGAASRSHGRLNAG